MWNEMSWDRMPGTGTEVPTIGEFLAGNPVPHLVPHDMSVTWPSSHLSYHGRGTPGSTFGLPPTVMMEKMTVDSKKESRASPSAGLTVYTRNLSWHRLWVPPFRVLGDPQGMP